MSNAGLPKVYKATPHRGEHHKYLPVLKGKILAHRVAEMSRQPQSSPAHKFLTRQAWK